MTIPRRAILSVLPALMAMAALAPKASARRSVINVRDYGATGDGSTDDSAAIQAAVRSLSPGAMLYFPKGSYRFAQKNPEHSAALAISAVSDVDIEFDSDAELVMDNLGDDGMGTGHAILIEGPASRIALRNVKIRWAAQAPRSFGDGIRIVGYPTGMSAPPVGWSGPPAPVGNVRITNCEVQGSPQAGVILMGVSDVNVTGLRVHATAADGLHFNACRRAHVDNYTVTDNGDDGLALVTYYSDPPSYDSAAQTFAFPGLAEWSNTDFTITNVTVSGGRANGVRFAGAKDVLLRGVTVMGKRSGAGVVADSTAEIESGADWQYVASQGVRLEGVTVVDCEMGIQLLARPGPNGDSRFTDFGVSVADANIRNCTNWAVRAESLTQRPVTGFRLSKCTVDSASTTGGNGGIGLGNTQNLSFGKVSVTHSQPVVTFSANDTRNLSISSLHLSVTQPDQPQDAPTPSALFDNCDGAINSMHVSWLRAPASWTPVHVKNQPVAIRKLSVKPSSVVNHLRTV